MVVVDTSSASVTNNRTEIFARLGRYTEYIGSYWPTFWDNLSFPSTKVKPSFWHLKIK